MSEEKKRSKLKFSIKGKTPADTLENLSFLLIVISAGMISLGIGLGSFFRYVILLASFGAFVLLAGIILFIVSEFMRED